MSTRWERFWKETIPWRVVLILGLMYAVQNSLLGSMAVVVRGVTAADLRPMMVLALLVGWLLARSRLSGWWASGLTVLSGFIAALGHVARINSQLGKLTAAGIEYLYIRAVTGEFASLKPILEVTTEISRRLYVQLSTLGQWLSSFQLGFSVNNQTVSLVIWGFGLWILTVWLCWTTRRYFQPLWGLVASGGLLAALLTYTSGHRELIVISLGAALALVGIVFYEGKEREWKQKDVANAAVLREPMTQVIVVVSLAIMITAAIVPSFHVEAISDPIQEWLWGQQSESQEPFSSSLGVEYDRGEARFEALQKAGLPRSHLIRSGPELEERVVMVVRFPLGGPGQEDVPRAARYWRAYTYDQYTGKGWKSSETVEEDFQPGEQLVQVEGQDYQPLTQEIRISNQLRGALYAAGRVETVDRDYQVAWRTTTQDLRQVEDVEDLELEDIFAISMDNTVYQVQSSLPVPSEERLRNMSRDYPDWIEDRYLVLPDTVPDRVLELAAQVVAGQPTAYDQAKAIETFLRTYTYTLDLPDPVRDRDVVDYFLFDLQEGYCDYYATSMVVMARAAGLPSRLVIGYVGGRYDQDEDRYLVAEAEAHSWPEVYFPEVGWIPFEPTAGRGSLEEGSEPLSVPPELDQPPEILREGTDRDGLRSILWPLVLVSPLAALLLIWGGLRLDLGLLRGKRDGGAVAALYRRLNWAGERMQLGLEGPATPYEFQEAALERIKGLARGEKTREALSGLNVFIRRLTDGYVQLTYSPYTLDTEAQEDLIRGWRRMRGKLLLVVVLETIRRWKTRLEGLVTPVIGSRQSDGENQ